MATIKVWDGKKFESRIPANPFQFSGKLVVMVGHNEVYLCDDAELEACVAAIQTLIEV